MAKALLASKDVTYQCQRIGEELCRVTQADALKHQIYNMPALIKIERQRIVSSPSMDCEFRLRDVYFWLLAHHTLQTMKSTSDALDFAHIPKFLESLEIVVNLTKHYPRTCKSFGRTAEKYKAILECIVAELPSPEIPRIDDFSVRQLENLLGASHLKSFNIKLCEKMHPYDSAVSETGCPECDKLVEDSEEVFKQMEKDHLRNNDFLAAAGIGQERPTTAEKVKEVEDVKEVVEEVKPMTNEEKFLAYLRRME